MKKVFWAVYINKIFVGWLGDRTAAQRQSSRFVRVRPKLWLVKDAAFFSC
jgi:hypothetical protein